MRAGQKILHRFFGRLHQSINELLQVVNSLQYYVYKKDTNLNFTNINDSFLSYIALSINDVVGEKDIYKFTEQEKIMLNQLERRLLDGNIVDNEQIIMPGSMGKKYALFPSTPIYNGMGVVKGIVVTLTDITENIKLTDKYQLIEQAINQSDDILYIKNKANDRITFISKAFYEMTGYHLDKVYNINNYWLYNVVYKYDRTKVKETYLDDNIGSIKYRIKTNSGIIKHVSERRFNRDNLRFGIIRDITKELEIEDTNKMLIDIINIMPESIWVTDNYGKNVRIITKAIKNIWGFSVENMVGKTPSSVIDNISIHPDDKKIREKWYESIKTKEWWESEESIFSVIHPEDLIKNKKWWSSITSKEWWESKDEKHLSEKEEFRIIKKNNDIRWIESNVYSTIELKNRGIRFRVLRDVTKNHKEG